MAETGEGFFNKGYAGKAEYDDKPKFSTKGFSVKELQKSFKESIDDYLAFCKRMGKSPDIPASGKLILRIPPELHSQAAIIAKTEERSLNTW